jgi:CheY-like chemotaxis protein/Zn finger protein HypA/HybF involved in hydrogenase expression
MISDQRHQSSESNAEYSSIDLTIEESFFLELLQKREKNTITIKITSKGPQLGNLTTFTKYYSETEILRLLESLVSKKVIIKQEKGAVLLCPKCGSYANMLVIVCPRCNSTKVGLKEDLNHTECEYWGPREEFIDGVLLRCPRCDEQLEEKALKGTPGYFSVSDQYFECQDCGTAVSKNNILMVCIKCSHKYTTIQASFLNSVSYVLASTAPVKTHTRPPKTIQEKNIGKTKPQPIEDEKPVLEPETKPVEDEKLKEKIKEIEKTPEADEEPLKEPIEEPELEDVEPVEIESEKEIIEPQEAPEAVPKKKKKKSVLTNPMKRVTEIFKKKPKKKTRKKKPKPEPLPEPLPEPVSEPLPEPVSEPELEEEDDIDFEEEPIEEQSKPTASPVKSELFQILMIVENVTVSEFVIESLEQIKKLINVIHVDEGNLALKELRRKYDAIILDLDLKTIDSKFILSEMEKWSMMTPIIALSDTHQRLDKYILNVETVLQKKQGAINKIGKILQKLL